MAYSSGLGALSGKSIAGAISAYLTAGTAPGITITPPIKLALLIGTVQNTDSWSAISKECQDANYLPVGTGRQSITWAGATTQTGFGYQQGYVANTNSGALTFGGSTGFAVTQTFTGVALFDSSGTPVQVAYQNFATSITVSAGLQYTVNSGSFSLQVC